MHHCPVHITVLHTNPILIFAYVTFVLILTIDSSSTWSIWWQTTNPAATFICEIIRWLVCSVSDEWHQDLQSSTISRCLQLLIMTASADPTCTKFFTQYVHQIIHWLWLMLLCFESFHRSSWQGKRSSLPLRMASATNLPNQAWYTRPRAPSPPTIHQLHCNRIRS